METITVIEKNSKKEWLSREENIDGVEKRKM